VRLYVLVKVGDGYAPVFALPEFDVRFTDRAHRRRAFAPPVAATLRTVVTKLALSIRPIENGDATGEWRSVPGLADPAQLNRSDREALR